ncbi:excinuclease ABC subunit A [Tropicibacter sp. S64]|uniref:excinuclease ABC subunit A n=1 Tax=Tropicibacter sp. S64 TaxID=3415122 RepID=UPI003C7E150F
MKRLVTLALLGLITATGPIAATASPKACPPGLAKKDPACMPPGLAKNTAPEQERHSGLYEIGERIERPYVLIRDPSLYRLNPNLTYYRVDGTVYQVNPKTDAVMKLIGAFEALTN